ncbi:hypothetical protein FR932_09540 [Moritella marina ATCC 15381]|uniref:Uncharacterized protein n=1 Tax=Moritella marina ATCC 15381 TaxID=1202962 RepID=A0A5J6WJ25_MORMI|nr:hypothetical protein [Moritella marina]QFI38076.1 hypothetical protein FR932_09540 [Moritella marina ATCC 15381]
MNNEFAGSTVFSTATDFSESEISTGALNDLLRQQLNPTKPFELSVTQNNETEQNHQGLALCVVNTVKEILGDEKPDVVSLEQNLTALFENLQQTYQQANIDPALRKRQFIARHGLVMSPDYCITTQKDTLRVSAFIRGAHQAIETLKTKSNECLHLVYPACGPFAPLLLPLITYYKETGLYDENDLRITLIDMQQGAIDSLKVIIHEMGIAGYINDICCQDACEYQPISPIHMVILEAMQHGFSREGHLPIARHFAALMEENGIFLPQEISLRAVLTAGQQEFVEQWQDENGHVCAADMQQQTINARVQLGEILNLTSTSLLTLPERVLDENISLIECGEVLLPELEDKMGKPLLVICTQIKVYGDEYIGEYDSGITHPLPDMHVCVNFVPHDAKPGDLLVKSGDKLKFFYRLNGLPGFLATVPA